MAAKRKTAEELSSGRKGQKVVEISSLSVSPTSGWLTKSTGGGGFDQIYVGSMVQVKGAVNNPRLYRMLSNDTRGID